jgi:hypothetical protein
MMTPEYGGPLEEQTRHESSKGLPEGVLTHPEIKNSSANDHTAHHKSPVGLQVPEAECSFSWTSDCDHVVFVSLLSFYRESHLPGGHQSEILSLKPVLSLIRWSRQRGEPMSTGLPWKGFLNTVKRDWRFVASCLVVASAIIYYFWK